MISDSNNFSQLLPVTGGGGSVDGTAGLLHRLSQVGVVLLMAQLVTLTVTGGGGCVDGAAGLLCSVH